MKKPLLITIIVLVVILILPAFGFIGWFFKEKKPLDIIILDKSVHSLERQKHHLALPLFDCYNRGFKLLN